MPNPVYFRYGGTMLVGLIRFVTVGIPSFPNPSANFGGSRKGIKMRITVKKAAGFAVLSILSMGVIFERNGLDKDAPNKVLENQYSSYREIIELQQEKVVSIR